jgi:hypothetical protein
MFSISPAKKQSKNYDKDVEKNMLFLAPFNKAPKINFGQVKPHDIVEKSLLVVNPQDFKLKLIIKNTYLNINNIEVEIERQANIDFRIKWQPKKAESYNFSIRFEVLGSRLQFIVHAFGVCVEPPKKKVFKNLTILQTIRPIIQPKQKKNNKENNNNTINTKTTTVRINRSVSITEKHLEKTYVLENSVVKRKPQLANRFLFDCNEPHEADPNERYQTEILKTPKLANSFHFDFNEPQEPGQTERRQTEILKTPKLANSFHFDFNEPQEPGPTERRQTEILKTPKLANNFHFDFNEPQEPGPTERRQTEISKTPKLANRFNEPSLGSYNQLETINSASVSNLSDADNYPHTPIFKEPLFTIKMQDFSYKFKSNTTISTPIPTF